MWAVTIVTKIRQDTGEVHRDDGTLISFKNNLRKALTFKAMVDVAEHVLHNADVQWNGFSSQDYWLRNYHELQAEDEEIVRLVRPFFIATFRDRPRAGRGIDVGSGTNLYPPLLMLPWTDRILLTDFSAGNVADSDEGPS